MTSPTTSADRRDAACGLTPDDLSQPCEFLQDVPVFEAVLLGGQEFTMELPAVFLLDAGHPHHTPRSAPTRETWERCC